MRTIKTSYNIDKLRLCYKQPKETFDYFAQFAPNTHIPFMDYTIHVIGDDLGEEENPLTINSIIYFDNGTKLGELKLNNSKKYEGYAFFNFENRALYEFLTRDVCNGNKYNLIPCIDTIADELNLTLNNITEIEVSCDTTVNVNRKIRRLIKDYNGYEMIKNGKRVADENRLIEDYHETFSRPRKRLSRQPTLYIGQAKADSPMMRIYNKSDEIAEESNKDYITDWNGFGNTDIHRIEVRLKNEALKEYLKSKDYEVPLIYMLDDMSFKEDLWRTFSNRLLYFKDKDGNRITMYDLANGLC